MRRDFEIFPIHQLRIEFRSLQPDFSVKKVIFREVKKIPPNDRKKQGNRINEQIRITPIRVIDQEGNQLGVIPTSDALEKAREAGLDLVEVAGDAKPPVCRIMDFGKFNYETKKRQTKNKSHQTKLKEIRVRPKTCLLYTSPSPRDRQKSRMPSSA